METPNLDWFAFRSFDHDLFGIGEPGHFEDVKSFLAIGSDRAMLVDSGMGFANIRTVVESLTEKPVLLVNSLGHLDHIGDNRRFESSWAHPAEVERIRQGVANDRMARFLAAEAFNRPPPETLDPESFTIPGTEVERTVDEGDLVELGGRSFQVLHTPGHSAGRISFFEESTGVLIAGDAVYVGPMFGFHPDASAAEYRATLRRPIALAPQISVVYPAHNRYPLAPAFISEAHEAMEQIWSGKGADLRQDGRETFEFGHFSFTFRETWREEA